MKINLLLIVLTLLLTVISCKKEYPEEWITEQRIFFNSFESLSDTVGWRGYAFSFANDAPSRGGKKSLSVSGGCIFPHAQYTLSAQNSDCHLVLKLWGKNLSNGGGVYLMVNGAGYKGIGISVSEKEWTCYESQDTLFCPANSSLTIGAGAGGIYGSSILIDMIEIRKF